MKLFARYLREKAASILLFVLFVAVYTVIILFYRLPLSAAVYPAALCTVGGCAYLAVGYSAVRRRHRTLTMLAQNVSLAVEAAEAPRGIIEEDYLSLLSLMQEEAVKRREADARGLRSTVEYYTVWAHQIKTPIAAMKLTLSADDSPASRKLSAELFRIERYVDMVMAYLRLDSPDTDYVFRECPLDPIIRGAVRLFASEFIDRRLTLDYETTDASAVTDEKWLAFVIEQLISNSLKYTREGGITIRADAESITVSDTGIGISPSDLPRIFERGFTGQTGRTHGSASGIGLYLCRMICDRLGIKISAGSVPGEGTTVTLNFGKNDTYRE